MSLASGTRLGPYEITGQIGAGGMGEVYRATDTNLKRSVAIKVLPAALAHDTDRLARFQREAEMLAALNHPHIAAIFGLERTDGVTALVMELVEGPTLEDLIAHSALGSGLSALGSGPSALGSGLSASGKSREQENAGASPRDRGPSPKSKAQGLKPDAGGLRIDDALPIARQIAQALEAAHEQNIIHRDLKPANIKVRADGTVKVLDFGLAKALDPGAGSNASATMSPTLSMHATQAGVILGTAAYMAPEQARGRSVDKRADIWAFGAVLYEMLTGVRAFDGEDASITLAAVLKEEPDWLRLPDATPPGLRRLLKRCLKKDPKERLRDIGDARTEIADLIVNAPEPLVTAAAVAATDEATRTRRAWRWATILAAMIAVGAAAGTAGYLLRPERVPEVVRFTISPPDQLAFNLVGGNITGGAGSAAFNGGAISPDGRKIAFTTQDSSGTVQIWVRSLDAIVAKPLAGTEGATIPFWSPDSRFLGFFTGGNLKKVDVNGGPPQTLASAPNGRGGSWSRNGVIVFAPDSAGGLMRVSENGGEPVAITTPPSGESHRRPSFLPDGRHFLYRASGSIYETPQIILASLDSDNSKPLLHADSQTIYSSGHLLFVTETTLMAQPFDEKSLTVSGAPFSVADQIVMDAVNGLAAFDATAGGILTYRTGRSLGESNSQLTWFDRTGKVVGTIDQPGRYNSVALFADGTRAAVSHADAQGNIDLWIHEFARGTSTRLTSAADVDYMAAWSPDGKRIAWSSRRDGTFNLYQKPSDGTGSDDELLKSSEQKYVSDWSPDSRFLLFAAGLAPRTHLFVLPLIGDNRQPRPYVQSEFHESQGRFSPDGRFVAYASDATGRLEVYVQPFPVASEGKWKISQGGGAQPQWRPDGKELFFISADSKLMAVDTSTAPTFVAGIPKALFAAPILGGGARATFNNNRYGVAPGAQRFLINAVIAEASAPAPITVVLNWTAGLKK